MELCGATLEQWLKEKSQRDKVESLKIFQQIIQGLAFLHKNNIIHRDIKPSNILFAITNDDSDLCVRIADFGLARPFDNTTTTFAKGTLLYMAQEVMKGKSYINSDMYSAGLILMELLWKCSDEERGKVFTRATSKIFPPPFENELKFAVPTLEKLLSSNHKERPSSEELLKVLTEDPEWVRIYSKRVNLFISFLLT